MKVSMWSVFGLLAPTPGSTKSPLRGLNNMQSEKVMNAAQAMIEDRFNG